jgi:hypothetical protein
LYPPEDPEPADVPEADPVTPLNAMPSTAAMTTAKRSCHVFHDLRPTMCNSPGSGRRSSGPGTPYAGWPVADAGP